MKKIFALTMALCMLLAINCYGSNIKIMLNGDEIATEVTPQIVNSRVLVPFRAVFQALGAEVDWNENSKEITATKSDTTIVMTVNSSEFKVNGHSVALDTPAIIIDNRAFVPVRAVSEALGCRVDWNSSRSEVELFTSLNSIHNENEEMALLYEKTRINFEQNALPQLVFDNARELSEDFSTLEELVSVAWNNNSFTYILKYMIDDDKAYVISGDRQLREIISQFEADAHLKEKENIMYSSYKLDENTEACLLEMAVAEYSGFCKYIAVVHNAEYGIRVFTLEKKDDYAFCEVVENSKAQIIKTNTDDKENFIKILENVI